MGPILRYNLILFLTCFLPFCASAQDSFEPDHSVSLEEFKEKALQAKEEIWVVDFWASWCRPCIMSMPELKGVQKRFQGKAVRFFSISWDDNAEMWDMAVRRMQMVWPQIIIPDPRKGDPFIDGEFPHKSIPSIFIVTREGKVKRVKGVENLERTLKKQLAKAG